MNRFHRHALLLGFGLGCIFQVPAIRAQGQEPEEGEEERVQYQLLLPEEKTPETVKPEERNPFESESESQNRLAPGDTEENRVRDILLKLPVVGTKRMPDGRMRVLLGNIILEAGKPVPNVLPEQRVELKVKNITTEYIELAWQEKRATGLPPKLMLIPINISPRIRYQMLGQTGDAASSPKGTNAVMEMPLRALTFNNTAPSEATASAPPPSPPQQNTGAEDDIQTAPSAPMEKAEIAARPAPETPPPAPPPPAAKNPPASASPPPSPAVESVVRMLFGNPTPAPK